VPGSVKRCIPVLLGFSVLGRTDVVDVQELVRRATNVMHADWAAAPDFAFIQRDVATSKGITTSKTHQVFIISGSDYYMPVAINDEALPPDQQTLELQKLRQEVVRRSQETPQQAQRRSERYHKMREQNGILLNEFTKAFDFAFAGEETIDGHATYVLDAKPRPAYHPPNRTARILTGMRGQLWIDQESFHWVKAEAEVVRPVSIFGLFARALTGTRMNLEMMSVTDSVWLVSRFAVDMRFSIFWHKSVKSTETIFSGYEPAPVALAKWLSTAPGGSRKTTRNLRRSR
jgi:hypothetical protein